MNNDNNNNMIEHDDRPYIMWQRSWLTQFMKLDTCDQKVLAVLYWDELTDEQKSVFSDSDYMEHEKYNDRKKQEIMLDPVKMRQHFLSAAAPILENMLGTAKGESGKKVDEWAAREVWDVLKAIITTANDPAPLMNLKGKAIDEQINEILTSVSLQKITIQEAKDMMSLVSTGFNLQELPKLMAKLEQIEGK